MEEWIKKSDAIDAIHTYWIKRFENLPVDRDNNYLIDKYLEHNKVLCNLIKSIPSADRPQGEWIPCSERLPEPGSWAIWCSIKGIIQVARWKEDAIDHFFPDQGFFNLEDAVAWMPLPEPWKGADDEVC